MQKKYIMPISTIDDVAENVILVEKARYFISQEDENYYYLAIGRDDLRYALPKCDEGKTFTAHTLQIVG